MLLSLETYLFPLPFQVILSPDADPPVVRIMDYKYDIYFFEILMDIHAILAQMIFPFLFGIDVLMSS